MIISAPPGTGKSTLAKKFFNIIDLDISTFDRSSPTRFTDYCKTAVYLSGQNYIMLVGTHKEVLEYFISNNIDDYHIIWFDESLKQYLLDKIHKRYLDAPTVKHLHAYNGLRLHFDETNDYIKTFCQDKCYLIADEDYNLEEIIESIINK